MTIPRRFHAALRTALATALLLASALTGRTAEAQQADVIRGHVTGPDGIAISGVRVTATSLSGSVSRRATTDNNGRFTIIFPGGDGDYFISLAVLGFAAKRFEVKRVADEEILIADATMTAVAQRLDTVEVSGGRTRVRRGVTPPDISGTERTVDPTNVDASQQGDLAAMAASIPGVTLVPGADGDPSGFSVLGLDPSQNATTLNGMAYGGSSLPRDAGVTTTLTINPYDVSRGGFSGAQFNIRPQPGSNYINRFGSASFDAPQLQWTDARGQALGQQYDNISLGGRMSGPLVFDKAFYNVSAQGGRRMSDLRTLFNTDQLGLETAGVSRDSAQHLLRSLTGAGIPLDARGIGNTRYNDQASVFGTFDFAPPSSTRGTALNATVSANYNRFSPATSLNTETAGHGGERTLSQASAQISHSTYFGVGVLSETQALVSTSNSRGSPFLDLPSGSVRVGSNFADGNSDVRSLGFGGNPFLGTTQSSTNFGLMNQLSWFSTNNKHRVKLTEELRRDQYTQDNTTNRLGNFSYNSLADFDANTPAVFMRQLSPRTQSGSDMIAGLSLGDAYRPTGSLQLQYGLRLDANRFGDAPERNPEVERVFGVRNDNAPSRAYVSPRAGFSYSYGTAPQIQGFAGQFRGPRATIRGGIGMFQNIPQATLIGGAVDNTGLPGAVQQLACVGPAAPVPDWNSYRTNPSTIPTTCADGTTGSVFANSAPAVTLFDKSFSAPRSLRSNLQWSGGVLGNRFNATFEGVYSRNTQQSSFVDLNFNPTARFTLSGEENRPVYVAPTSIVPATGAVSGNDAQLTPLFSHVREQRSDMRSESRQASIRISPTGFNNTFNWSLAYVLSSVREQTRGFSSTSGNPYDVESSRAALDSRHQISYNVAYNAFDWVRVSLFGSFRSGTPYTPQIGSDINGDGYANDRAFVFDPARTTDAGLATAMRSLLSSSSKGVRDCLQSQLGKIAGRDSCEGPWTSNASLSFAFNPLKVRLPQRASLSFAVSNPLGAADLLMHGENNLRGWGQTPTPDQSLLFVRGFDQGTKRFTYDVNQRFGATNAALTTVRAPVTLTAQLRLDLGPSRERQNLTMQLDRGRTQPGQRVGEPVLKSVYGSGDIPNPMGAILRQADTLRLTGRQADSLATLNRRYMIRVDSIWTPVAKYLASLPDHYDQGDAYARYRRAREATVDMLLPIVPGVRSLLTPAQIRKLPDYLLAYLDTQYLASIRSGTMGQNGNASLFPSTPSAGPMQMGAGSGNQIIIH